MTRAGAQTTLSMEETSLQSWPGSSAGEGPTPVRAHARINAQINETTNGCFSLSPVLFLYKINKLKKKKRFSVPT